MDFYSEKEIESEMVSLGVVNYKIVNTATSDGLGVSLHQKESDLWKLFIILALLMLLAEVLVLRFWK